MALGQVIARLSVHLGLETSAFEKGSKRAESRMSGFQKNMQRTSNAVKTAFVGMLGVFAVDQLLSVTKAGLDYASSLGEVATQLGVSTRALQEYRYAASQAGIEQSEMDVGLSQLTRRLGDAAQGAKEPSKAFERLGINIRDANGQVRDAGDIIPLIAEGLKGIESPAERAAILVDLFGKSGQKLAPLLEGGAAGVNNLRDAAHKLGVVLDDGIIQDADDAADKLSAMKQVMEAKIAGFAGRNAQLIVDLADKLLRLAEAALKAADAMAKWLNGEGPGGKQAVAQNMRIRDPGTTDSLFNIRPATQVPTTTRSTGYIDAFGNPYTKQRQIRLPKGGRGGGYGPKAIGANAFGGTDWSQFAPGQGEGFIRMAAEVKQMVTPLQNVVTLTDRINIAVGAQMVRNFQQAAIGALNLADEAQSIMDRLFPEDARRRKYIDELAKIRAEYGSTAAMADQLAEAEKRLRNEWIMSTPAVEALSNGFSKYMQAANDASRISETTTVRIARTFNDMAQDVIGSMNQLSNSIRGGGFLDILTGVVGLGLQLGGAGLFGKKIAANINRVPAFATGTKFAPGGLALVGERGPELVNLPRGSSVTPNNELGGIGGIAQIVPSPYFDVVVDGRIVRAGPGIAQAGAAGGVAQMRRSGQRRVA